MDNAKRHRFIERGLRRIERGNVTNGIANLLSARAGAELRSVLHHLEDDVRGQLERDATDTMRRVYVLLNDQVSLSRLYRKFSSEGSWKAAVDIVLSQEPLEADKTGAFRGVMEHGSYDLGVRVWKSMLSETPVAQAYARGETLRPERQLLRNHFFRLLADNPPEESLQTAAFDRLVEMCVVARDVAMLEDFRSHAKADGQSEWAYRASTALNMLARENVDLLPSSRTRVIESIARAMDAGDAQTVRELVNRLLRQHGMPDEGIDVMNAVLRWFSVRGE